MGLNVVPIMLADRADGVFFGLIPPSDDLANIPPGFDFTDPGTWPRARQK